jgi:DNA-binding CsgD family transcriptional regulator
VPPGAIVAEAAAAASAPGAVGRADSSPLPPAEAARCSPRKAGSYSPPPSTYAAGSSFAVSRSKITGPAKLTARLRQTAAGLQPPALPRSGPPLEPLTPKEKEIATLVVRGYSNREIANRLFMSPGTVRNARAADRSPARP